MERVVIVGTSGSGKSTLARRLAACHGLVHLELDEFVHGPKWMPTTPEVFRQNLEKRMAGECWVCDGNYFDRTSEWVWPLADTVVWLDMPLWIVVPRLIHRSVRRILTREELWNGNREGIGSLIGRDSVLSWAVASHRHHAETLPEVLARLAASGTSTARLCSPADVERWFAVQDALAAS